MSYVNSIPVETVQVDAFSQLYDEYYSKIYKYTLFRVGDHSAAEDLVSEIFEKVFVKYHTYKPEKGKLSTWLFTISNNTIINYYKKNKHNSQPSNFERIESRFRLEDLIIEQELKEYLLKAISCLDERQRNIIALKFGACLTNRQIAQIMSLTESNVGTVLYRALKYLKDVLKEQKAI